jgi:hypothetical protein
MAVGGRVVINDAALHELLTGREGPVARRLEHAVEVGTQAAKRRCPVSPVGSSDHQSGQLRSAIGWHLDIDDGDLVGIIGVDPASPASDYALPVELGAKPHTIRSHGDYPLRNRAGQVFGREVHHPGNAAQPYLRPAVDDALAAFTT